MTLSSVLEKEFFPFVARPARYMGNEWGSRDYHGTTPALPDYKVAVVVPDIYDRGMCLPELQLVYNFFREHQHVLCDRAFAPDLDAEQLLRAKNIPLFSLETQTPLGDFDILLFLIPSELRATAVMSVLDLSGIPASVAERSEADPRTYAIPTNPLNAYAFGDLFDQIIGEDVLKFLQSMLDSSKPSTGENAVGSQADETEYANWAQLRQKHQFSQPPIIPFEEVMVDRLIVTLPENYRPTEIAHKISNQLAVSGYEEFSLQGDVYRFGEEFRQLCTSLGVLLQGSGARCVLPVLPPNLLSLEQFDKLSFGRKRSLRLLLGAGSEFLREGLGLFFDIDDCFEFVANAFARGWKTIRADFFVGMPEETEEDLQDIVEIAEALENLGFEYGERHNVQITLNPFIPHLGTKWQWDALLSAEEYQSRGDWIKRRIRKRNIQVKMTNIEMAVVEGLLARGGESSTLAVKRAYDLGARFDSWPERFSYDLWTKAFADNGIDVNEISRAREPGNERLPVDSVSAKLLAQLRKQRESAFPSERHRDESRGITIGDIVLSKPEVAEQILAPKSEDKRSFGRKPKRVVQTGPMIVPRSRVRLQWKKSDQARHVGHLACMKMFERAIRRARIPVEYTQGQQPRQKVSLGPPLALGYTSDAEYFDLHLEQPYQEEFLKRLNQQLPEGFAVVQARPVFGKVASVSSQINLACYEVDLDDSAPVSEERTQNLLEQESVTITRHRGDEEKQVDVRPAIIELRLNETQSGNKRLEMALGLGNLGFVRPDEVLSQCLNLEDEKVLTLKIHRRALLVVHGERRLSPFEVS